MDRNIVYPGAIPQDTDILNINRNVLIALGYLAQATLGTASVVDGLAIGPTSPASMSLVIGPGVITAYTVIDANAYGSLPADPTDPLLKMGINTTPTTLSFTAPTTPGQSIDYLIEASFLEEDTDPVVLPYYNAANPAVPFSGPANNGAAQNTVRIERVALTAKPGVPAASGTQTPPPADPGWIGLYVVSISYGTTSLTSANVTPLPTAPFIPYKLPALSPGVSNLQAFSQSGTFVVPAGVTRVRVRLWGGGGGGGAGGGSAGAGGSGGGYGEGYFPVSPGQSIAVTVGIGGGSGAAGGTTTFGTLASASGGAPGSAGSASAVGIAAALAGGASGTALVMTGQFGQNGLSFPGGGLVGGMGGGTYGTPSTPGPSGAASSALNGTAGFTPGGGGSGGVGSGTGGAGGSGLVIVEW
jgi:hypothetical protein